MSELEGLSESEMKECLASLRLANSEMRAKAERRTVMDNKEIYKQAIEKFGEKNQIIKAVEELAELQKASIKGICCKYTNNNEVAEEIADVEIMLEQLKLIFDCHDITDKIKTEKIERLKGIVNNGL